MTMFQDQRPRFFEGQYLGADDLETAVAYGRIQDARHALGAHTWGIAVGLQLQEKPLPNGKVEVYILPGFAWDGFGRPIVLLAPFRISEALFSGIAFEAGVDDTQEGQKGRLFPVWLRYDETATQPARPGFEVCETEDQHSRVRESFRVEIGTKPAHADRHDPVRLAGRSVDAEQALKAFDPAAPALYDESVPHQAFPGEGERARWLVPIGYVRWLPVNGAPGHFAPRDDADRPPNAPDPLKDSQKIRAFRRYIGVVAETVHAPDGAIRLRDRFKDPGTGFFSKQPVTGFLSKDSGKPYYQAPASDLVWVEGPLRVEGNARLAGGSLDFRDQQGKDNDTPLLIRRTGDVGKLPGQTGDRTLQVLLGPEAQTDNRLTVGPLKDDGSLAPHLMVRSDGRVGMGTNAPDRALTVQGAAGTYVNVKADGGAHEVLVGADGNGGILSVMTNHDLQLRAGGNVTRMVVKAGGRVGIGTVNPGAPLHISGPGNQFVDLSSTDPEASVTRLMAVTSNGVTESQLQFLNILRFVAPLGGITRMTVHESGNVGIGLTTPVRRLHVVGDRVRLENAGKRLDLRADGSAVDLHSETNDLYLRSSGAGNNNRIIMNPFPTDGSVGVGTEFPGYKLHVLGDFTVQNGDARRENSFFWTLLSDARLKTNIEPVTGVLDRLLRLRGVRFEWSDPAKAGTQMGLIAQEVEPVFPEWVRTGPHGYKELTLQGFEAVIIEAFRELARELGEVRGGLEALKSRRGEGRK